MNPANHPDQTPPSSSPAAPSVSMASLPPVIQARLGALEDKIEFYSLGLPAIAVAHLILWSRHALFASSSAIDDLMGRPPIPPYPWCAFATAILFILLFAWSFRQRVLAMQIGLLTHISTIVVILLISRGSNASPPVASPRFLAEVAALLYIGAPIFLFLGIRASSQHAQLLQSLQTPNPAHSQVH